MSSRLYSPEVLALIRAARSVLRRPTDLLNLEKLLKALEPFDAVE